MTPREVWCNEAQERYVLAIAPGRLDAFRALCERERCPFAVVGDATDDDRLEVRDPLFGNTPVDMDLPALLGKPPRMTRDVARVGAAAAGRSPPTGIDLAEAVAARAAPPHGRRQDVPGHDRRPHGGRPLRRATRWSGPWQVPVADCADDAPRRSTATPARPSRWASARRSR